MSSSPALDRALDDSDDLRGFYFRLLLGRGTTRVLIAATALVAGIAGLSLAGPVAGLAALAGELLVALLVVLVIADSRSEDAFFAHYAAGREMVGTSGRSRLPGSTPLLRKGDDRYAVRVLEGPLGGDGSEGLLALFTYEEHSSDGKGHRRTTKYEFTITLTEVPASVPLVPELFCRRKSGLRALEGLEDAFRSHRRVEVESLEMDRRYEIFVSEMQDDNPVRQLFSPTFIVWLTESAPEGFGFELVGGRLCARSAATARPPPSSTGSGRRPPPWRPGCARSRSSRPTHRAVSFAPLRCKWKRGRRREGNPGAAARLLLRSRRYGS